jgi:hypothetical protein
VTSDRDAQFADFVGARSQSLLRTAALLTGDWAAAEDPVDVPDLGVLGATGRRGVAYKIMGI